MATATPSGTYEIGGITTGTKPYISDIEAGNAATPLSQATIDQAKADAGFKPVSILSTENAKNQVTKDSKTLNSLTPPGNSMTKMYDAKGNEVMVGDPSLNSQYSLNKPQQTPEEQLMQNEVNAQKTPEVLKAEQDVANAKSDKDSLSQQLGSYFQSDASLQPMLDAIGAQWDARIKDMERVNNSRVGNLQTLGNRTGSQYTGGNAGGVFGGIISEEERQGVTRIGELNAQKLAAIQAAKQAQRDNNWKVYSAQTALAQTKYDDSVKELDKLTAIQTEANKKLQEKADKAKEAEIRASRDGTITGLIEQGITDPSKILQTLNYDEQGNLTGDFTFKEINDITEKMKVAEKVEPGIVGEWLAAKKQDASLKDVGLMDYIQMKSPESALDIKEQQLRIQKIQKELDKPDAPDIEPMDVLAYGNQYAVTGQIPTGLPKGTFGLVAEAAKDLPKANGIIVNKNTNVADSKVPAIEQADYSKLVNIKNNVKRLKELDQERMGGVMGGTLGAVFGQDAQSNYLTIRKAIVDDMSRMQSGAALTPEEISNYEEYIPGRFSDTSGASNWFFEDSMTKIENFETFINNRLNERLDANNLSIYGYSKVDVGGKQYTIGSTILNSEGKTGRINADGSITPLD